MKKLFFTLLLIIPFTLTGQTIDYISLDGDISIIKYDTSGEFHPFIKVNIDTIDAADWQVYQDVTNMVSNHVSPDSVSSYVVQYSRWASASSKRIAMSLIGKEPTFWYYSDMTEEQKNNIDSLHVIGISLITKE